MSDILPPVSEGARFEPALGCQQCFVREQCGGLYVAGGIDCLHNCCGRVRTCTLLCPKSHKFLTKWRDIGGISARAMKLRQESAEFPAYIPLIQHGHQRATSLPVAYVGLTTFDVTRRDTTLGDMIRDPAALRAKFRLSGMSMLLLVSVAPDCELETYWRNRRERRLIDGIKAIKPAHVVAPNFSLFRDVPRFDNLANIKRSQTCAEEFSVAGLSVIPYVAGITGRDWECWTDFIREHTEVRVICKEFQTGPAQKTVADWHLRHIQELQQRIGRKLHVIAVGGRRHRQRLSETATFTIVDSVPFMRTMHRRMLTTHGWRDGATPENTPLDELLRQNIQGYSAIVRARLAPPLTKPAEPTRTVKSEGAQLLLWPPREPGVQLPATA